MISELTHSVEIFFVQKNILMLDFAEFGVIVEPQHQKPKHFFSVYFEDEVNDEYVKLFMKAWEAEVGRVTDFVKIQPNEFQELRDCFFYKLKASYWPLLRRCFPKQVGLYLG